MRALLVLVFAFLLPACAPADAGVRLTSPLDATVLLQTGTGHCAAVAYSATRAVTAKHCVEDVERVKITLRDGTVTAARVIGRDAELDVAVVELVPGAPALRPATFGRAAEVEPGDPVILVGHPHGFYWTVSSGSVAYLEPGVGLRALQLSVHALVGNSGGAVFDRQGRVIGLAVSIFAIPTPLGPVAQGISFAIPVDALLLAVDAIEAKV